MPAQMSFFKYKRNRIRNESFSENLKINSLEGKLTNASIRTRWYGHTAERTETEFQGRF
jgi:hypothetical protein